MADYSLASEAAHETPSPLPPLPELAGHTIHLFHQLERSRSEWNKLAITFGSLLPSTTPEKDATGRWLPAEIRAALADRYAAEPVWERVTVNAGADFHAHLRRLVSGLPPEDGTPELAVFWTTTARTRRLLEKADIDAGDTPREARHTRCLVWSPTPSARRRIAAEGVTESGLLYGVDFTELMFLAFRTGKAFVRAAICIRPLVPDLSPPLTRPLAPVELLEATTALARVGKLVWLDSGGSISKGADFTMNTILRSLVGGGAEDHGSSHRSFTYTYARFAAPVSPLDADRFALYLARHYTRDYALRNDAGEVGRVRDFDTVGHVVTLEGAATVVSPDMSGEIPSFLKEYATVTLAQHYVPIALLALHERAFLVDQTTDANFWPALDELQGMAAAADRDIQRLRNLSLNSLRFRLAFRFSQVSMVSMHNAVYRAFRQAFGLDRMLVEMSTDVAEAWKLLDEVQRERSAARVLSLVWVATAVVGAATVFNVANAFFFDWLDKKILAGWISLAITVFAGITIYFAAKQLKPVHGGHKVDSPWTVLAPVWSELRAGRAASSARQERE